MSPMRSACIAGSLFGAMMGIALMVALFATVPVERPAPQVGLIGPGQPVSAVRAPVLAPGIDRDSEPDFGVRHAEAVSDDIWLRPSTLNIAAPDMIRLQRGTDALRPQMPRPALTETARERPRPRRPPIRVKASITKPRPTAVDPGPASSGPRWPTYLVKMRKDRPDWRLTVFGGR